MGAQFWCRRALKLATSSASSRRPARLSFSYLVFVIAGDEGHTTQSLLLVVVVVLELL